MYMASDIIKISKDELFNLIREAVRAELNEFEYVSDEEQKEIDKIYGNSLNNDNYDPNDCIRL